MSKANVLGGNLLVETTGEDDALLHQAGQDLGRLQVIGQIYGRHAIGLVLGLRGQLLQTHVRHGLLDLLTDFLVDAETVFERTGQDLGQRRVQGVDELWGRSGKV